MKLFLLLICLLGTLPLWAQISEHSISFDPEKDPIAIRSDSSIQLVVSEFILAKSLQARMGKAYLVQKIYQITTPDGMSTLIFEGINLNKNRQKFNLGIPLNTSTFGRFYYASNQALVCSAPGCNNCSILNGNCVGCCSSATGSALAVPSPLAKVQTSLDE